MRDTKCLVLAYVHEEVGRVVALGAHEAPTQNVILVTSDFRYFFATNVDVQSTSGLT